MKLSPEKVRVDKWLWSVRLFKTRTLASHSCRNGDVRHKGKRLKPSHVLTGGELLDVRKDGFNLLIKVTGLLEKRVSAPLARECYENLTSEEEMNKYKDWFIGKAQPERREKGAGRPTKKDRRTIDQYKDTAFWED